MGLPEVCEITLKNKYKKGKKKPDHGCGRGYGRACDTAG